MTKEESDAAVETEIEKTFTIVGYLDNPDNLEAQEWLIQNVDAEKYGRTRTEKHTSYRLEGDGFAETLSKDEYNSLAGQNTGDLKLIAETTEKTQYVNRGSTFMGKVIDTHFEGDEFETLEGHEWESIWRRISREEGDTLVRFYKFLEPTRMLKHRAEASADDPFTEDETEYLAAKIKVKVTCSSDEELSELTENYVEPFYRHVATMDHVNQTRIMDCETRHTEKGVCYNV